MGRGVADMFPRSICLLLGAGACLGLAAATAAEPRPGARLERKGDEIVACGQLFHTTAPVVLWTDPGGYDAYRVERRFVPAKEASWDASKGVLKEPVRFGLRRGVLSADETERVRGGGWDLPLLQRVVDKFVIHFDAAGTSRRCFEVLHDRRGLSVQFMLDLDGTIYQTLDLKEGAWHATKANAHSIGIEIANIGAYPADEPGPLDRWYRRDADGHTRIVLPDGPSGIRDTRVPLRPIRDEPVVGMIQGQRLRQYDLTAAQYDSLIKLTAALCTIFPEIRCDYPRDASGHLIPHKLPDDEFTRYHGLLGHYHVQTNKVDPGPAFQWDRLVEGARGLMKEPKGP
jgi:N-acetylmuramoyl-L-alanine amidase